MRTLFTTAALLSLACSTDSAEADGLFYRLPEDGAWVEYKVDAGETKPNNAKQKSAGTLTVSSVGTETVGGQKCRWIEIKAETKRDGEEAPTRIWKMLIPEKHLVQGHAPFKQIVKVWVKIGDRQPRQLDKNRLEIVQLFLMGPPEPEKKLASEEIESGLGALDCKGVAGKLRHRAAQAGRQHRSRN